MMSPVPRVKRNILIKTHRAQFRVAKGSLKICVLKRSQKPYPASMKRIQQIEREFDRGLVGIGQPGPTIFEVRPDRGLVLSDCEFESNVAIHVTLRHMMNYLADRPSFRSVRRVELVPI